MGLRWEVQTAIRGDWSNQATSIILLNQNTGVGGDSEKMVYAGISPMDM